MESINKVDFCGAGYLINVKSACRLHQTGSYDLAHNVTGDVLH